MAARQKTWREKLEVKRKPEVVDDQRGRGRMLIPRPLDVNALIRKIKQGKLATVNQIREYLANKHNADFTCPLTAGIFIRISAEAAEEDLREGRKGQITPWWRVVKADGSLNPKLPGGTDVQAARLRGEGHAIEPGEGKKPPQVKDFEKVLQDL